MQWWYVWKYNVISIYCKNIHWSFIQIRLCVYIAWTHEAVLQNCTNEETMQNECPQLFSLTQSFWWHGSVISWYIKKDQHVTRIQRTNISLPCTCQRLSHMMQTCILREGTQILLSLQDVVKADQINTPWSDPVNSPTICVHKISAMNLMFLSFVLKRSYTVDAWFSFFVQKPTFFGPETQLVQGGQELLFWICLRPWRQWMHMNARNRSTCWNNREQVDTYATGIYIRLT